MDAIERLTQLLDQKDAELQEKDRKIEDLERRMRFGTDWMTHQFAPQENDGMPVPRIELQLLSTGNEYSQEWEVTLVMPGRNGVNSYIPYTYSKVGRTSFDTESFPLEGKLTDRQVNELPSLVNDACFLMEKTGMPGFVILDADIDQIYRITSLRPLQIEAVPIDK